MVVWRWELGLGRVEGMIEWVEICGVMDIFIIFDYGDDFMSIL